MKNFQIKYFSFAMLTHTLNLLTTLKVFFETMTLS